MHARVRELLDYAALCGFEPDGTDGRGHHRIVHPNGTRYQIPSTPGDYRGDDNAKADMRRLSGVTPPRPRAGKYRGTGRRPRFSMRAAILNRRDDLPGTYTTGDISITPPEPLALQRLKAEEARLTAEYQAAPTGAIEVQLRNVRTRIERGIY